MGKLTFLEDKVIRMLLDGDHEALAILRQQIPQVTVTSRKLTAVGFITDLGLSLDVPRIAGQSSFKLGDVDGAALNVRHGMGFLLSVTDGALTWLEGYTYDEPWPNEVQNLVLTYRSGKSRNMDVIKKLFHIK